MPTDPEPQQPDRDNADRALIRRAATWLRNNPDQATGIGIANPFGLEVGRFELQVRTDLLSKVGGIAFLASPEHGQTSSGPRIRPMAAARRRHWLVFSASCARPFGVSE